MKNKQLLISMMLQYDFDFQVRCLMVLYDRQTVDEQQVENSVHQNHKGFNSSDAPVLSPIAEAVKANQGLNSTDKSEMFLRLPKYARQLVPLIGDEELASN